MSLESITRNAQALQRRVIFADPAALRECADRLEQSAKGAVAGESVLCELTAGITILFRPEIATKVVYPGDGSGRPEPLALSSHGGM